jgi:hypothetical protein
MGRKAILNKETIDVKYVQAVIYKDNQVSKNLLNHLDLHLLDKDRMV